MPPATNIDSYLNNHYQGRTPEQLIQMLYKGALRNLSLAKKGIEENNCRKRGEHIGKAIAIITELYVCLDAEIKDESIQFLRGLYSSMLAELPKVSLTNDVKTLDLTYAYINQLNHIWETEVLKNTQGGTPEAEKREDAGRHKYTPNRSGNSLRSLFA